MNAGCCPKYPLTRKTRPVIYFQALSLPDASKTKMVNSPMTKNYKKCLEVTRVHAKTFYFCSLFLEKEKRLASYSVYAFSRIVDDEFDLGPGATQLSADKWKSVINSVYGTGYLEDPVLLTLRETVKKYRVPDSCFLELIAGMEMDITKKNYSDFSELYVYCYRVAGVMGIIMAMIFGLSGEEAAVFAEKMGVAMQLTNILRDIKQDLEMGRVYIPADEMCKYNVDTKKLLSGTVDENFINLMKYQIRRARSYYSEASLGLPLIPDPNARFVAELMGIMYSGILDSIEKNNYDVFSGKLFVPTLAKVRLAIGLLLKRKGQHL